MTYNVSCINALVVYVGSQAILQLNKKTPIITHSAPMDVFHLVTFIVAFAACDVDYVERLQCNLKVWEVLDG